MRGGCRQDWTASRVLWRARFYPRFRRASGDIPTLEGRPPARSVAGIQRHRIRAVLQAVSLDGDVQSVDVPALQKSLSEVGVTLKA